MDATVLQKFKDNLPALAAGAILAVPATWQVADTFNKREVAILERQLADFQKRLDEKDALLKSAQQSAQAAKAQVAPVSFGRRKTELESLIKRFDRDIAAKQSALAAASPMRPGDPEGDLYLGIKRDITALKQERDEANQLLIHLVGR
jgi:hypothetical protein